MNRQLNDDQAAAVAEFGTDLLVTAGAGTGKTSVLTGKFLRLLEDKHAEVNTIVAITFTKKAAAEMRTRIMKGLEEHVAEADPIEAEYWRGQLRQLDNARIGTFHSICLGLIREHPLEAGITPATRILDEGEALIYLNETVEEVILDSTQIADPPELLIRMIMETGWKAFCNNIGSLYQTIRESGASLTTITKDTAGYLEKNIRQTPERLDQFRQVLADFLAFAQNQKLTANAQEIIADFREDWDYYQDILTTGSILNEIIPVLEEIRKALPRTVPVIIKERINEIHELSERLARKLLDEEALRRLPVLIDLLAKLDQEYSSFKLTIGVIDFTDQILLARQLLTDYPALTTEIRAGIDYLLVDEFQDTNSLQLELVELLAGKDYTGSRLMVVGDVKQSIYRFRGARAELIQDLAKQLKSKGGRIIPLTQNYRSNALLIDFVNAVSQPLFATENFTYEPLAAAEGNEDSQIELLLTGTHDRVVEARMIASRIIQLVRDSRETAHPIRYGDIVLLFRASTAVLLYQQALQEQGIPYYTASGGSFYKCQEVVDQLNLLRLVEQRYDSLALLALLSSPFVALSDESLLWLAGSDITGNFYNNEFEYPELITQAEQDRLWRFRKLIIYLQANREFLSIPDIIRLALERCDYREVLWTGMNATQRIANLEKLLDKAEEFTGQGFHDLRRFLDYIETLQEVEVLEGEAQTQAEASNAVRLMTIHRAKGLEFPVVILPDLDHKFNRSNRSNLAYHKEVGIGFTIPVSDELTGSPSTWEKIRELDRREEIAELKRVLYVALTRAKQQLILAGSGCSRSRAKSVETADNWMKWFELLLPLDEMGGVLNYQGVNIKVTRELPVTMIPAQSDLILDKLAGQLEKGLPDGVHQGHIEVAVALTRLRVASIKPVKVSELLSYQQCPRRYYWEYIMRLKETFCPEQSAQSFEDTVTDEGEGIASKPGVVFESGDNLGARIGNFVHQAVRMSSKEWPENLWQKSSNDLAPAAAQQLKTDLQRIWTNYQQSEFTGTGGRRWDEVPFLIELGPGFRVEGRFDRLIETKTGELVLVDYKTHRSSPSRVDKLASAYFQQLQIYALAVRQLWDRLPDRAVLYFPYPNRAVTVPLGQDVLDQTAIGATRIIEFINTHFQLSDYQTSDKCEGCGYWWFCQQGKE